MSSHTLLDMCTKAASFGARLLQFVNIGFVFFCRKKKGFLEKYAEHLRQKMKKIIMTVRKTLYK